MMFKVYSVITRLEIAEHVGTMPAFAGEVFEAIISKSGDSTAASESVAFVKTLMQRYGERTSLTSIVNDGSFSFIDGMSAGEIQIIVDSQTQIQSKFFLNQILVKPFYSFWAMLGGSIYDLDGDDLNGYHREDKDSYFAVGYGIFWAGMHFLVKD